MTPEQALSLKLQDLAREIEAKLSEQTGIARCPFVLLAAPNGTVQYVANVTRKDGIAIIGGLLQRWQQPDLPDLPEHQKDEIIQQLLVAAKDYHAIVDTLLATLIDATAKSDHPFMPTQSPVWPDFVRAHAAIVSAEGKIAFASQLSEKGPQPAAPEGGQLQ